MILLARLKRLVSRFWLFLIGYAGLILIAAYMQQQFVYPDIWIADALIGTKPEPQLDSKLAVVDLGCDRAHTWRSTVALLTWVSSAVKAHRMYRPADIVLDIFFSNAQQRPSEIPAADVVRAIKSIRYEVGTPIYATVDPYASNETGNDFLQSTEPLIYDVLTGNGHTEYALWPDGKIGWYDAQIYDKVRTYLYALSLVVTEHTDVGSDQSFGFIVGAPGRGPYTIQYLRAHPRSLDDRIVIVGSSKAGDTHNGGVPGMIYTSWAFNDLLGKGKTGHIGLFSDPGIEIIVSLALSLVSAVAFAAAFGLVRSLSWRLLVSSAAGTVVPTTLLVIIVAAFASQSNIYVHPTFAFAAILITTLTSWLAGRLKVRYERVVSGFEDGTTKVLRRADVFVSYSRDDENIAWVEENIVKPLRRARRYDGAPLDVFFDLETIHSGMSWYKTILDAIWGSRFMIAVYTPRYFERPMCTQELLTAMRRIVNDSAFQILPVSRMAASVPLEFADMQIIDALQQPNFIDDIIARLSAPSKTETVPTIKYDSGKVTNREKNTSRK
jgi:hypothetical protein